MCPGTEPSNSPKKSSKFCIKQKANVFYFCFLVSIFKVSFANSLNFVNFWKKFYAFGPKIN